MKNPSAALHSALTRSHATYIDTHPGGNVLATSGVQAHIRDASGCFDVYQVTEYRGNRIRKDGAHQVLTIRIFDSASENEHPRFHVEVEADDGARTTGHPAHSLEGALQKVAWEDLDP